MKQVIFDPCDKGITFQAFFRTNLNHLPCASCGSTLRKLGIGKGPHTASLRCGECDCFIRWVGKSELVKIQNQGGLV
jgi:hypothetical protein